MQYRIEDSTDMTPQKPFMRVMKSARWYARRRLKWPGLGALRRYCCLSLTAYVFSLVKAHTFAPRKVSPTRLLRGLFGFLAGAIGHARSLRHGSVSGRRGQPRQK